MRLRKSDYTKAVTEKQKRYINAVSFLGYSKALKDNPLYKDVVDVAKVLAERDYTIVNGGGPGVMEAASVGAHLGGGKSIGVTFYPKDIQIFEGRSKENKLDKEIVTRNYLERTLKLLEYGDAYIIFNGGTGTISEFGMAWGLARLYFGHHKPFILYGEFWADILSAFAANMLLRPEELLVYKIATSPEDVVRELEEFEQFVVLTHLQNESKKKNKNPFSL